MPSPTDRIRRTVAHALRDRVAGKDAPERAQRIWGASGPRWFTEEDPIWRVHADASMFPAGITALLLQSLHPQAMAGVAGHSGYKGDPWGRLQRTSEYLATTTFGTIEDAEATIARVRAIHERVRGRDHRGRPYRASDPALLRWVHVAEAWAFLQGYQRYSRRPLSAADADRYVEQSAVAASRLGATELPSTLAQLEDALRGFRPTLQATPAAFDSMQFLLLQPPLPIAAQPGYALLAAGGVGLLPRWARTMFGIPLHGPLVGAARLSGHAGTAAVRWAMASLSEERRQPASAAGATASSAPAGRAASPHG